MIAYYKHQFYIESYRMRCFHEVIQVDSHLVEELWVCYLTVIFPVGRRHLIDRVEGVEDSRDQAAGQESAME